MKGKITGEDDVRVGLHVTDNNDAKHRIEMEFDGEIKFHQCDAYADNATDRTDRENELNEQARRFAKLYVYQERGYETIPRYRNPDRIATVRRAILEQSRDEFERFFGDLVRQLTSHHDDEVASIESVPGDVDNLAAILYHQNVYLGIDPLDTRVGDQARTLATDHGLDLTDSMAADRPVTDLSSQELSSWKAFTEEFGDRVQGTETDLSDGAYVDAVSGLYISYFDTSHTEQTTEPNNPFEREPDVRIELSPIDPPTEDDFKELIVHHLACQIRDSFVLAGVIPPEEYRVLGFGRFDAATRYKKLGLYPKFHDPEVDTGRVRSRLQSLFG